MFRSFLPTNGVIKLAKTKLEVGARRNKRGTAFVNQWRQENLKRTHLKADLDPG